MKCRLHGGLLIRALPCGEADIAKMKKDFFCGSRGGAGADRRCCKRGMGEAEGVSSSMERHG